MKLRARLAAILVFSLPLMAVAGVAASFWELEQPTPLMKAAFDGDLQAIDQVLSVAKDKINDTNEAGSTPLIFAIAGNRENTANYLLKHGANPNKCATYNMCPIWYAVNRGSLDITKQLLVRGANPNSNPGFNALEWPMLHTAAAGGRVDILRLLVDKGANLEFSGYFRGDTALAVAVAAGQKDATQYLLNKGANLREATEKVYSDGLTAFQVAQKEKHSEVIKLIEETMRTTSYVPKYSFEAILRRIYEDPDFDMKYDSRDLDSMLKQQTRKNLRLLRNAVFAKYNYQFDDQVLVRFYKEHFSSYKPLTKNINLNKLDKQNVEYLKNMEEYASQRDAAG